MGPASRGKKPKIELAGYRENIEKFSRDNQTASSPKFKYLFETLHYYTEHITSKIPTQKSPISDPRPHCFPISLILRRPHRSSPCISFVQYPKAKGKEDMNDVDTEPLRSYKVLGFTDGAKSHQRRRRPAGKPGTPPSPARRTQSFSQDFGHAAAETYLITRLSFTLLRYLGVGSRWITRLFALGFYALLLMPGFLQVAYYYFFSSQVRRSVVYGDQPRNRLDLYLPENNDELKPVVIFVTGGAWIIGYKAWGSLLGKQLAERDIIVACLDYRNFPQGTISDMIKDSSQGISFVCNHIAEYGGDPNRIYLMGQSAGAHISACALVEQAIKESESGKGESISWSVSQLKAYFGLSGGYNLLNLVDQLHKRGLYSSIFLSIMEGEQSLQRFSPEVMIQDPSIRDAVSHLPPITLFHGTSDYSIPSDASKTFADTLQRAGAQVTLILFEGKTHTDLFLQDPLRGGKDELFDHIVADIHAGDKEALAKDAVAPPRRRLVPEFLLQMAREISPF